MKKEIFNMEFSNALLTGLFVGILTTLVCLVFAVTYRYRSGFSLYLFINFPATIFGCNLLLPVMGILFYFLKKMGRMGEAIFILSGLVLTAWCLYGSGHFQRSPDPIISEQFKVLLGGYILILGLGSFAGIPLLYHNRRFLEVMI